MTKLILSHACSPRGADMGRPNLLPLDILAPVKLHLERLRWVDQDYDAGGAYWGNSGDNIYCAWGKWGISSALVQVFARAHSREEAKEIVREKLPRVTFYR